MRAVQELTIFDGLKVHLGKDVRGALAIPTQFVTDFGVSVQQTGHCGQYTTSWIGGKDKSALELSV